MEVVLVPAMIPRHRRPRPSPAPAAAVNLPSEVEEPDAEAAEIVPETFGPEPRPAGYETPPESIGSDMD